MYIYKRAQWPKFTWDQSSATETLGQVKFQLGKLIGKMEHLGLTIQEQATLEILTSDVIKTSEIEGELLDHEQVRSSVARHLGLELAGLKPSERHVDGIVEILLDATRNAFQPLTSERLCQWHAMLFPTGISGLMLVNPGVWRSDSGGPMQVVSGSIGREKVHFEAPPAKQLTAEIKKFLTWFNQENQQKPIDLFIKAGIAHLWFVTLHPFDDGNGRISRAIADMMLSRADRQRFRFYSMSTEIRRQRKSYYEILEKTQKGSLDISPWIHWFLQCLEQAVIHSESILENVLNKSRFWEQHASKPLNERQTLILNMLFDGFKGKLTSGKWAKVTKCSQDTATRDINQLVEYDILIKGEEGGRSTNYILKDYPINSIG